MSNKRKFLNLSIDLEEFDALVEYGVRISEKDQYEISRQGLIQLVDFLKKSNLKVTFFTTVNMAKAYPELLKSLAADRHEIALHAVVANKDKDLGRDLQNQKAAVEEIIKREIYGCRTHKLVSLPEEALNQAGFIYDNSLHPTYVPGRYCNIFKPKQIHDNAGIIKVPVSVTPVLNLPFSWFWFRNFGFHYAIFCSRLIYFSRDYINIYLHSWDFADIDTPLKWRLRPLIRNSGYKMLLMFDSYIQWCQKKELEIIPMLDYLKLRMEDANSNV